MSSTLIQRSSYTTTLTGKVHEKDGAKEAQAFGFMMTEGDDNNGNIECLTGVMNQSDETNCVLILINTSETILVTDIRESVHLKIFSVLHVRHVRISTMLSFILGTLFTSSTISNVVLSIILSINRQNIRQQI